MLVCFGIGVVELLEDEFEGFFLCLIFDVAVVILLSCYRSPEGLSD